MAEIVGREPAGEGLEDQDAEAPDVGGLGGAVVVGGELRRLEGGHVAVGVGGWEERGEGVVGEKGSEVLVEKDVGGFQVAVWKA